MNVNTGIKQAAILAIGIIALGICIKSGLEDLSGKDRKVVVKGLAEKEVEADKVTFCKEGCTWCYTYIYYDGVGYHIVLLTQQGVS